MNLLEITLFIQQPFCIAQTPDIEKIQQMAEEGKRYVIDIGMDQHTMEMIQLKSITDKDDDFTVNLKKSSRNTFFVA